MVMPRQPEAITPQFMQAMFVRVIIGLVVGIIIYLVGTALASSATAYAVSMVHLGKTTTIAESYSRVKPIFLRILWLLCVVVVFTFGPLLLSYVLILALAFGMPMLLKGAGPQIGFAIAAVGGALLLLAGIVGSLIWMLYALCRYALAVTACTLEKLPARISLVRSKFLTYGAKWSILGIVILTGLMSVILTYALELPALLASNSLVITTRTHLTMAATVWIYVAGFLGGALAGPVTTIALALVYYDQRVRKEAFDLQLMMEAVGQSAPAPPAAAAPSIG
jgi:hypothetical protein